MVMPHENGHDTFENGDDAFENGDVASRLTKAYLIFGLLVRVFIKEYVKVLDDSSSESRHENLLSSQGSWNCNYVGSDAAMNCPSHDSGNSFVDQKLLVTLDGIRDGASMVVKAEGLRVTQNLSLGSYNYTVKVPISDKHGVKKFIVRHHKNPKELIDIDWLLRPTKSRTKRAKYQVKTYKKGGLYKIT
ncbi:hypothetical protein L6452_42240 [Arctium lappa]|uniref:Uncharacterized protein n=1 Tax=Arctium lappa TaxID=4217 RepID=A0ACB8XIV1_ARCLA|nr:hypothetical protein L6452_42240 [Arctium lappa]